MMVRRCALLLLCLATLSCGDDPEDYCGDGAVTTGEECDDGNKANADGCEADCTLPVCGNDVRDPGEECDDGNNADDDGCDAACAVEVKEPICGDGFLDEGEVCEDGGNLSGDGCRADCGGHEVCGDGMLDQEAPLTAARLVFLADHCGGLPEDPVTLSLELAGTTVDAPITGDCVCEPPITTIAIDDPAVLAALADGTEVRLSMTGERGRLAWAKIEVDSADAHADIVLVDRSGRRRSTTDGNDAVKETFDRCSAGEGTEFVEVLQVKSPLPEACDDGDVHDDATCRSDCRVGFCGDGKRDVNEECDADQVASCEPNCTLRSCGNRRVDLGEECDDGNLEDLDRCSNDCRQSQCGDGIKQLHEGCDVEPSTPGDGCDSSCVLQTCRDGDLDPGEVCDDGNGMPGDGCSPNCASLETCGNGVRDPDEECDDGNRAGGDGCSASCEEEESLDCGNAQDDDNDGLVDCLDPDCAGLAVCRPGSRQVGAPCESPSDCQASADDPLCLPAAEGFEDGMCSEFCDDGDPCPVDSVCIRWEGPSAPGVCLPTCVEYGECRFGYHCSTWEPDTSPAHCWMTDPGEL